MTNSSLDKTSFDNQILSNLTEQFFEFESNADSLLYFESKSSIGSVGISLILRGIAQQPMSYVEKAIYLGAAEEHLQKIEQWLGISLHLKPLDQSSLKSYPTFMLSSPADFQQVNSGSPESIDILVHLPADAWNVLAVKPEHLSSPGWLTKWSNYPAELELARIQLAEPEMLALKPGAVVLIPESFRETWDAFVRLPDQQVNFAVEFEGNNFSWALNEKRQQNSVPQSEFVDSNQINSNAHNGVIAKLVCAFSVNAEMFINPHTPHFLSLVNRDLIRWDLQLNNGAKAHGYLGPVGKGHALFVDKLSE